MLDGGIIQRLLEEKWKTFARVRSTSSILLYSLYISIITQSLKLLINVYVPQKKFLKRLMILGLHLLLLSVSVYLRHSSAEADGHPNWGLEVTDARSGIRLACELGTISSTLCYIILQQGDEIKNQGLVAYFKTLVRLFFKIHSELVPAKTEVYF